MSKIRCRLCGDVIESRSRHDLVSCRCGEVFVDGGPHYLRTGARTSLFNIEVLVADGATTNTTEAHEGLEDAPSHGLRGEAITLGQPFQRG